MREQDERLMANKDAYIELSRKIFEAVGLVKEHKETNEDLNPTIETVTTSVTVATTELHKFFSKMHDLRGVVENAQASLKNFPETVLPPARDMNDVLGKAPGKFEDIEFAAETTTENVESLWDQMADGLQTKWASSIGEMLRGAKSLKDGLEGIWDAMLIQFTDMIGQMVAKWTTDLIGGLLSSSKKASGDIAGAATGAAGGGAGGTGGIASLAGGASPWGAIAGGVIGGIGAMVGAHKTKGAIDATNRQLHFIWTNTQNMWNVVQNWEKAFADWWGNLLDKQHMQVVELQKIKESLYGLRRDHKAYFGDMVSGQSGLDMITRGSGLAKYHSGERLTINPNVSLNPQFSFQTLVIEKPTQWVIKIVQENLNRGNIRVPPGAVK